MLSPRADANTWALALVHEAPAEGKVVGWAGRGRAHSFLFFWLSPQAVSWGQLTRVSWGLRTHGPFQQVSQALK